MTNRVNQGPKRATLPSLAPRPGMLPCRTIFKKSSPVRAKSLDVLLNEMDLPPRNRKYATELDEDEYNQEFPQSIARIKMDNKLVRFVAIVPFYPKQKTGVVIPIPFILDTGAPGVVYLGRKTSKVLDTMKYIGYGKYFNKLTGNICWLDRVLEYPIVEDLPEWCEMDQDNGDIRTNLLGIEAIDDLEMMVFRK